MKEKEFNLLEEPWIRVRRPDCTIGEVSLTDALLGAHAYAGLAGELPTQDVAVLRLLLAVLHTVVCRYDPQGGESPLRDEDDALERWKVLWERGRLPQEPILDYLSRWRERFWLFHPERPFYQVAALQNGIEFSAAKLNGEISQGENKPRLFVSYAGEEKDRLSYAQAARWLLYINGYDEKGGRPKPGNPPRKGVGWLGQIGFIAFQGITLFETLMRNLILLEDGEKLCGEPTPCWEDAEVNATPSCKIGRLDNQARLLTMQSRRILLERDPQTSFVTGFSLLGGDYIDTEEISPFIEQYTLWKKGKETGNRPIQFLPRVHEGSKQLWREFPALFREREPGVIKWNTALINAGIIPGDHMASLVAVSNVYYPKQESKVIDTYADSLSFHMEVINSLGNAKGKVILEVNGCEKVAERVGRLARDIDEAAGGSGNGAAEAARERFYFAIDRPFRQWLYELDPEQDVDGAVLAWRKQAAALARRTGRALVEEAGPAALVGRAVKEGTEQAYLAAPKAFNRFLKELSDYEKGRYAT